MYRRMLVVPEVSSGHLRDFLAFGMEPPLIVTGVVFSIALTCLLFVFKSGQLGTVAVALSGLPDMMLVVFSVLTIAEVLPWDYVPRPNSVMHVLAACGCLLAIKIVLAACLIGTPYYPKAEK
ncbi:hypothetical protein [Yoonia sp. BS5-3]|uniref:HPP family protein n=1 Tax=Yoonia phaeophyticola TaxID=3137369 RepID=A0ABZ2V4M4_9RHOB